MNNSLILELIHMLHDAWPQLSLAVYDPAGKLLCSAPSPLRRKLSHTPHNLRMLRGSTFTAAFDIPGLGILSMGGKTGSQQEAETVCSFAESCVRALKEKAAVFWRLSIENDPDSTLLKSLFTINNPEDISYVSLSASACGYDLTLRRAVILLELLLPGDSARPDISLFSLPMKIRTHPDFSNQDIIGWAGEKRIVICKALSADPGLLPEQQLAATLASLESRIRERYGISVRIGVSGAVTEPAKYTAALTAAQRTLSFARLFGKGQGAKFYESFLTEAEVAQIPKRELDHFFARHIAVIRETGWISETIEALIQCNMQLDEAAKLLFVHRNTLSFRLKQMRKNLDLDPVNRDSDYFTMLILYIYMKLYHVPVRAESQAAEKNG